jgi:protein-S-isoprenylcysteine O-methyltransferase Ste14
VHVVVDVVFAVGWVAFWVYWLLAAGAAKQGRSRWGLFAGSRVVMVAVVLLVLHARAFGHPELVTSPWLQAVGLVLFLTGLAVAVWARVTLGRNWGMPMTEKVDPELVSSGPYRRVRHPIYSGMLLAMVGTSMAVSVYWLVLVALLGAYFVFSASHEERYMVTRFPEAYPRYQQTTKMLIPFVF